MPLWPKQKNTLYLSSCMALNLCLQRRYSLWPIGGAGYLLAGYMISGAVAVMSGGSGTEPIEMDLAHLILEVLHWLHLLEAFGAGAALAGSAVYYFSTLMAMGGLGLAIVGGSVLVVVGFAILFQKRFWGYRF